MSKVEKRCQALVAHGGSRNGEQNSCQFPKAPCLIQGLKSQDARTILLTGGRCKLLDQKPKK